jgi:glucokinase
VSDHSEIALVFDVGGSHISAGIRHALDPRLIRSVRVALPVSETAEAFVETLVSAALKVNSTVGDCHSAAIAIAGPFDYKNGISYMTHKLGYLYEFDLKSAIASRFGWSQQQVKFLPDADAFLMGEIAAGAAQGFSRVVGITLGTGTGSAFAIDGQLIASGTSDPIWQELWDLPYNGARVEDFLSTRAIQSGYERLSGNKLDVRQIAVRGRKDPAAQSVFAEFGTQLGTVVKTIIAPFSPQIVVVGGGIAHAAHLFLPSVTPQIAGLGFDLRVSSLLDQAPLLGAAVRCFSPPEA